MFSVNNSRKGVYILHANFRNDSSFRQEVLLEPSYFSETERALGSLNTLDFM